MSFFLLQEFHFLVLHFSMVLLLLRFPLEFQTLAFVNVEGSFKLQFHRDKVNFNENIYWLGNCRR